jgi:homoserine O-acetyltransferase
MGGADPCHHQSRARRAGRRRCRRRSEPCGAGDRGARRVSADPLDWIYQSWAYDAHDVGTTSAFGGDTAAALRTVKAPTLLVIPGLDLYNPVDDAIEAATLVPNATLVHLDGRAGHAVAAETSPQLDDIRVAIDKFLTSHAGRR